MRWSYINIILRLIFRGRECQTLHLSVLTLVRPTCPDQDGIYISNGGPRHHPPSGRPGPGGQIVFVWTRTLFKVSWYTFSYQHIERMWSRWLTFLGGENIMKSGLRLFTYNDTLPSLRICYSRLFLHPRPECPPWNYKIISKLTIKQGLVCHVSLSARAKWFKTHEAK